MSLQQSLMIKLSAQNVIQNSSSEHSDKAPPGDPVSNLVLNFTDRKTKLSSLMALGATRRILSKYTH
jgi:hypothetical protein